MGNPRGVLGGDSDREPVVPLGRATGHSRSLGASFPSGFLRASAAPLILEGGSQRWRRGDLACACTSVAVGDGVSPRQTSLFGDDANGQTVGSASVFAEVVVR